MSARQLSKELQDVAIKELNEDPKRVKNDLNHIKTWLAKQPHITARTDDQYLLPFLRGCKYSLERTKEKLDMLYTLKTITPEMFENRDPFAPEIQKVLSLGITLPLPVLPNAAGPRYTFIRNGIAEKHKINLADVFKVSTMIQDILMMEDDNFGVTGVIIIQDMSDVTMSHAFATSPSLVKKALTCFQHAYPQRIKEMHFFNISSIVETIYNLFKPFMGEKLKKRTSFYTSINSLYKSVPRDREVLPEEYGGSGGKIDEMTAHWKAKVESYREWFLEDAKYKTDEKKRPGKPKTVESVFGLEGSFRQLSVD